MSSTFFPGVLDDWCHDTAGDHDEKQVLAMDEEAWE
jgi:hypothetical protein